MADPRNAISLAAVAGAAQGDDLDDRLFFNSDATTVVLELVKETAVVSKEVQKSLRKDNLCPSVTEETPQKRTITLVAT